MPPRIIQNLKTMPHGFTFSQVTVITLVLCALWALLMPHLILASDQNREAVLSDRLRSIQGQLRIYQDQHEGRLPGFVCDQQGHESLVPQLICAQLTQVTDRSGNVIGDHRQGQLFGPYFSSIPANPFTSDNRVLVIQSAIFPRPDESQPYGWIFSTGTGQMTANVERPRAEEEMPSPAN